MGEEEGSLGALLLKLGIDTAELLVGMAASEEATALMAKKMEQSTAAAAAGFEHLGKSAKELAAVVGITLGVEAFKSFVEHSMEGVEKMALLSDRIGVSTTSLYGLKMEADETGTNFDSLTGAMTRLERSMVLAEKTGSTQAAAMRELGVSMDEVQGKRPDEVFGKISDALNGMSNQTRRGLIEFELFGRGYAEIENVIRKGSAGMDEATQKAKELGDSITRVDAQKVIEAEAAFKQMKATIEAVGIMLSVNLAPYLQAVAKEFIESAGGAENLRGRVETMVEETIKGLAYIGNAMQVLKIGWDGLVVAVAVVEGALATLVAGATQGLVYLGELVSNFAKLMKDEWEGIGTIGELVWLKVKAAVGDFVQYTAVSLAALMEKMGSALPESMAATKRSMDEASGAIRGSLGGIGSAAEMAFIRASDAAEQTKLKIADDYADLAPSVDDVMNNKMVQSTRNWASSSVTAVAAATDQLKKDLAAPWDTEKVDEYMNRVKADMDAIAKAKAAGARGNETQVVEEPGLEMSDYEKGLQAKLAKHMEYVNKDLLAEQERYDSEKETMKAAFEQEQVSQGTQDAILEDMAQKHKAIVNGIQSEAAKRNLELWESGMQGQLQVTGSTLTGLTELMHSKNREMFEIGKAAAYSRTVINTAEAAMGAYNSMVDIPYVGPALAAVAMASAIAAGAIELSTISSTSFGGGGSVSNGAGAGGGGAGPSAPTGAFTNGRQGGARNAPTFNLNFAPGLYSQSDLRMMNNRLNAAAEDGQTTSVG